MAESIDKAEENQALGGLPGLLNEVLQIIATQSTKLMKLKFSNMFLRNDHFINSLCEVFKSNKNMIFLDVSWGNLQSPHLSQIAKALVTCKSIRNINMSYN